MAVTYTLTGSPWRAGPLMQFIAAWAPEARPAILRPLVGQRKRGNVDAHLFADGSLRGVVLSLQGGILRGGALTVTLGTLANRTDWILGLFLLRALVERGPGALERDDGAPVLLDDLTQSAAELEAHQAFRADGLQIREALGERRRHFAALVSPRFDLFIVPADLPGVRDERVFLQALDRRLQSRARRYHESAELELLYAGDGTPIASWRFQDVLFPKPSFVAAVEGEAGRVVPWNQFARMVGPRLEVVSARGERYHLRGLVPGDPEDDELRAQLREAGVDMGAFLSARVMTGIG